jgi:hypothetical protein
VVLETSETEITKSASFEIRAALPVPLEAGCRVTVFVPRTLKLDKLSDVVVGGMFGSERSTSFSIKGEEHAFEIKDACLSFRENQGQVIIKLSSFNNPGYVIRSEDFKLTFTDYDANFICSTNGGLHYSTTPGTITVSQWSVTSSVVNGLTSMLFSF